MLISADADTALIGGKSILIYRRLQQFKIFFFAQPFWIYHLKNLYKTLDKVQTSDRNIQIVSGRRVRRGMYIFTSIMSFYALGKR